MAWIGVPRRAGSLLPLFLVVSACSAGSAAWPHGSAASMASRLIPDRARLAGASPELRARLAASPIALFRFVNQAWTREACEAFAGDLGTMPTARLHGDAHVEQYAVTQNARGLDDFDDSARGPAVVDIVRFVGSLELTSRERGWGASLPSIIDGFFDGYQRALEHPADPPADPAVVTRLRGEPLRTPRAFLTWADSLMQPLAPGDRAKLDARWRRLETYAARVDARFTPAFLAPKKVGWLHLGIGSAVARKILIRAEGPSPALDDDVVIEAKEVAPLRDVPCVGVPASTEPFRVIEGVQQIGRLHHRMLMSMPMLPGSSDAYSWWVKTWDRSYRELEIADLATADELREVARDVGAQLGSTNLSESWRTPPGQQRLAELRGVTRLGPRMRVVAHELTVALVGAWQEFRRAEPAARAPVADGG
jgi:uncharacterized protein (DUF2252 family)